jgi:hypothetical protein
LTAWNFRELPRFLDIILLCAISNTKIRELRDPLPEGRLEAPGHSISLLADRYFSMLVAMPSAWDAIPCVSARIDFRAGSVRISWISLPV